MCRGGHGHRRYRNASIIASIAARGANEPPVVAKLVLLVGDPRTDCTTGASATVGLTSDVPEVFAKAGSFGADVVMVGSRGQGPILELLLRSRGRTGLTRALLGMVVRNVVDGSNVSVLVVREVTEL